VQLCLHELRKARFQGTNLRNSCAVCDGTPFKLRTPVTEKGGER
jgi:hypothetical protein